MSHQADHDNDQTGHRKVTPPPERISYSSSRPTSHDIRTSSPHVSDSTSARKMEQGQRENEYNDKINSAENLPIPKITIAPAGDEFREKHAHTEHKGSPPPTLELEDNSGSGVTNLPAVSHSQQNSLILHQSRQTAGQHEQPPRPAEPHVDIIEPSSSSNLEHIRASSHHYPKQSNTIAVQVDEDELLAKTISTQTSDVDLRNMASPRPRFRLSDPGNDSVSEQDDKVDDNFLRPVASCTQLHGILRKTPSAKWGSQSTVAFDEHNTHPQGYDPHSRSTSIVSGTASEIQMGSKKLSDARLGRSDSHGELKKHSSVGQKLSGMFHLGHHEDQESLPRSPSESGLHMGDNKHASFAHLPDDTTGEHIKKTPWWRKIFPKKKEIPRSFTMEDLKQDLRMDDHVIPKEELFAKLDVNPQTGLSDDEAASRLARDGPNCLTPPKRIPEWLKMVHELVGGFSPMLEIGSALCFIAYGIDCATSSNPSLDNLYLAIVLLVVVLITSFFLYSQKAKSERIMEGFKNMLPQHANVIRGGKAKQIVADNVVLGDIVDIQGGDRIPADVRLLETKTMKVDNSSLTGESEAQSRSAEGQENPLESKNLAFYTTNAVEGWGRGVVIRRGDATVMGRIAKLTTRIEVQETTIAREMRHFVTLIAVLAFIMGAVCIIVALALGYGIFYAIILAIGLVVANVPEGIIITVTVMLTLTAQRMAKKNCLIKNLQAVETLGSCSVICSDKTGTLTQNRMTVAHCWVDDSIIETDTSTEKLAGKNLPETGSVKALIRIATLCNRARFKPDQDDKPIYAKECVGDASETALLKFTEIVTGDVMAVRAKEKAVAEIPFNSTTKFQVSVHEIELEGRKRYLVVMKGAPERIWDRCATVHVQDQEIPKDANWDKKFNDAYIDLGGLGERVLGFCDYLLPEDKFPYPTQFDTENPNFPLEGLRFVGLISLIDPPRAAVPDAVAKCRSAGIQVIMVTGDHPVTAKAIARSVGIISEGVETAEDIAQRRGVDIKEVNPREAHAIVIHGGDLRELKSWELDDVLRNHSEIVFARTSPQQKLIIVEACQRLGAVVAVTGDGVNDSPALKKSNIGIAMGITGSDVSKQAADMVLLDDNFASIITGIEEGRLIFDNLKKTICYTLMANIPEIAPVVMYFICSIPLGLQTIPMLLVCLGTDMIPSISMAFESAESDIMKLPPRDPNDRLVNSRLIHCTYMQAGVICAVGAFFTYFVTFGENGFRPFDLFGTRDYWENPQIDDLKDSYGQEWTYGQRVKMQRVVEGAFFISIVIFQWLDLINRKCRRKSVFQKGMRNWQMDLAIVFETVVAIICVYVPGLNWAFSMYTVRFVDAWLPMIPFALFFFAFDELRRYVIRRYPGGWCEKEFYF